ncbi:hypothetical protein [Rhodococcus jostii]|uniref:hypothetical protein n=1 Tax=Rhodococcus jostii TaxID=132919 RepID=UPI00363F5CB0
MPLKADVLAAFETPEDYIQWSPWSANRFCGGCGTGCHGATLTETIRMTEFLHRTLTGTVPEWDFTGIGPS